MIKQERKLTSALYVKQERKLASASQERKLASASPEKEVNFGKLKSVPLQL